MKNPSKPEKGNTETFGIPGNIWDLSNAEWPVTVNLVPKLLTLISETSDDSTTINYLPRKKRVIINNKFIWCDIDYPCCLLGFW